MFRSGTSGVSQYLHFENVWCTPCAVCGIPNAPTGGGDRDGQCGNQNMCFVFVSPCTLWCKGGGPKGKIKTG